MNRKVTEEELQEIILVLGDRYLIDSEFRIVSLEPHNSMKYCVDNKGKYLIRLTSISKQNTLLGPKVMATSVDNDGYIRTAYEIPMHRLVAQAFLEDFDPKLVVDHIVPDKQNNSADNLQMLTMSENTRKFFTSPLHAEDRKRWAKAVSDSKKGVKISKPRSPVSEETKRKISEAKKGIPLSETAKQHLSDIFKGTIIATNGTKNIRILKGQPIPEGFWQGWAPSEARTSALRRNGLNRKGKKRSAEEKASVQNRIWITNGSDNKWIDKSQLDSYLIQGYFKGRSKTSHRKDSKDVT